MTPRSFVLALSFTALTLPILAAPAFADFSTASGASLAGSYLIGRVAGKQKDVKAAAEYTARALQFDPDNPVLIERLFQLQLSDGKLEDAAKTAEKVLTFNSQHRMSRIVLGLQDFKSGQYAEARSNFAEAAYTPVGELTAALLSAWSFAAEGNLADALNELNKLDSNESFANFKNFHAALISDFLSSPVRADASYRKARETSESSLRIAQAMGNFLERNGKTAEAQAIYKAFDNGAERNVLIAAALTDSLAGKTPEPFVDSAAAGVGEALFSLAAAMTDDQSVDVALLYTQMALAFTNDKPVMTTLLGDIFESGDRFEDAIAAYDQTAKESPLRNNADTEIGLNFQRLGRTKEAQVRLQEVIARDPKNYSAIVTLGNVFRNNEQFPEAAASYDKAIALITTVGREHWRVFYYRAIALERQKLWPKAEADFRKALSLEPEEPTILNYLGYSMIEKKINLEEAIGMVKKAVEAKPNDGYIVDSLGWAFYQLGDYENAVVNMERAVELAPADPLIGEHLGDAYWQVGRKLEAQFQWQHAKDNKPDAADLIRIEGKLKNGMPMLAPVAPAQQKPALGDDKTKPSNG
jgi:tetratricopeptide (TPR) repeat protein